MCLAWYKVVWYCGISSYTDCRVFKLERTPPGPVRGNSRAADSADHVLMYKARVW